MAGTRSRPPPLAAGVVAYRPEVEPMARLVSALLEQVDILFLYCNSPLPAQIFALVRRHPRRLAVLGTMRNLGLGVAHNRIVEAAMAAGSAHVLLFDQDSYPSADLAPKLRTRLRQLTDAGGRPALVGPRPISVDGASLRAPRQLRCQATGHMDLSVPVPFLISSGSLIDVAAFRDIGGFRDDFFIDVIDVEWCLRARSKGYTCWMATDIPMAHRLGAGTIRLPWLGITIVRCPPLRTYTIVRNQLALMRLAHVPARWKVGTGVRVILETIGQAVYASQRRAAVRWLARGWRDGLRGRLGPPALPSSGGS